MAFNIERVGRVADVIDQKLIDSGNKKIIPTFPEQRPFSQNLKLFKGIAKGFIDWVKPDYDLNKNTGQRNTKAQEAVKLYKNYKTAAKSSLDRNEITEEDYNYLKGKVGARSWINYYINSNEFPKENKAAAHVVNFVYQLDQTLNSGQSWGDGLDDLIEQGRGIEDTSKLESPYKEIQKLKIERIK